MHVRPIPLFLLLGAVLCAAPAYSSAPKDESLQDLVTRAQAAHPEDRPGLYVEIMERQLKAADKLYGQGNVNDAVEAIHDIVTYSDKAHDSAVAVPKKLKGTEIALRKIASKLRDIRRTLIFEQQPPVQAASEHIEVLRTDLLNHMFAKD